MGAEAPGATGPGGDVGGPAKLVRDRIPEIIAANGGRARVRAARPAEVVPLLLRKVAEEAREVEGSGGAVEEVADLLEAVSALCRHLGLDPAEVAAAREHKRVLRGGFDRLLVLEGVDGDGHRPGRGSGPEGAGMTDPSGGVTPQQPRSWGC